MTQQVINVGTTANDGTGDPLRTAFQKTNANFSEVYLFDPSQSSATASFGYKGLPLNIQDAVYTFVPGDNGKMVVHTEVVARVWTIDTFANQAISTGAVIALYDANGAGAITVTPAVGVTLLTADGLGNAGARTVSANSMATIIKVATNTWIIIGSFT